MLLVFYLFIANNCEDCVGASDFFLDIAHVFLTVIFPDNEGGLLALQFFFATIACFAHI